MVITYWLYLKCQPQNTKAISMKVSQTAPQFGPQKNTAALAPPKGCDQRRPLRRNWPCGWPSKLVKLLHTYLSSNSWFIYLPTNLSIYPSTHLSIYLCVYLSIDQFIYCLYIYPCIHSYTYLFVYLSIYAFIYLIMYLSMYLVIHLVLYLSICLSVYLSISLCAYLSTSI